MYNVFFKINQILIASFEVDIENNQINNINIVEGCEKTAKTCWSGIVQNPTCNSLLTILKFYLDKDHNAQCTLEEILNEIIDNGFYTPYQHNLKIEVNKGESKYAR